MTTLVILPGLDGTGTLHGAFAAYCREVFGKVVTIPYPVDQCLDYEALEAHVRQRLPSVGPFILLAESFSGPIGCAIAASPPANLCGLVLCTSFVARPLPLLKYIAPLVPWVPMNTMPSPLLAWMLFGRWASETLVADVRNALLLVQPRVLKLRAKAALQSPRRYPQAIELPVLYLRASGDRVIPRSAAAHAGASCKDIQLVELQGPHLLLQAQPQACAEAVAQFARLRCDMLSYLSSAVSPP